MFIYFSQDHPDINVELPLDSATLTTHHSPFSQTYNQPPLQAFINPKKPLQTTTTDHPYCHNQNPATHNPPSQPPQAIIIVATTKTLPPQAIIIAATTKTQQPTILAATTKTQQPITHHPNRHNQNPTTFLFHHQSNPQPPRITNPHTHHLSNPTTTLPKSSQSLKPSHTH